MLCLPGVDSKSYGEVFGPGVPLPEVSCPDPGCGGERLRGHGWYGRYLEDSRVALRRLRCRRCEVTHAVLPAEVCAYRDLKLEALEAALVVDGGPAAQARAAGQPGPAGVRRVRRWRQHLARGWALAVAAVLPPASGRWWERVREVFGCGPGWLVRLRQWLWLAWGEFFSGLSGLFRQGRPRLG
jgi:hypothetical protein